MLVNLFTAESQSVTNATSLFIRASEARERLEVDQKIDHCAVSFIVSVCVYGVARFVKHLTTEADGMKMNPCQSQRSALGLVALRCCLLELSLHCCLH